MRQRRISTVRSGHVLQAMLGVVLGVSMLAQSAQAQLGGFRLDRYEPTTAGSWLFRVERPWYAPEHFATAGLTLGYAHDGLRFADSDPIVAHSLIGSVDVAGSPGRFLLVRVSLPLTFLEAGTADPASGLAPQQGTLLGDPRVGVMVPIFGHAERNRISLHLGADGWFPAHGGSHQGDQQVRLLAPRLVLAGALRERWRFTVEAGFLYRPVAVLGASDHQLIAGSEMQVGAALGFFPIVDRLHVGIELRLTGRVTGYELGGADAVLFDALLGAQYRIARQLQLGAALGTDASGASGTPDLRALLRIAWVSRGEPVAVAVSRPAKAPAAPPPADADSDGIPDEADRCPEEPEDQNGVRDEDGCPEADGGAALEALLPRPRESPKPPSSTAPARSAVADSDSDGIPDSEDRCPLTPEDKDQFEDDDGCPDPDNDGDGIPDARDRCPLEAETANGFEDEDGCPDTAPTQAQIVGNRIEIKEQVQFRFGKAEVDPRSYDLLRQVAAILRSRPTQRIEVQGHTDNQGDPGRNLELSQQRADKVREFLIQDGLAAERLTAKGYGPLRPRVSNATKEGRAENRRVEFWLTGEAK